MRPIALIRRISARVATAAGAARPIRALFGRRRVEAALALVLVVALAALGFLAFEPASAGNDQLTGKTVPTGDLQIIQTSALACPALTASRLAAQVMAASGFDSGAVGPDGEQGLAGLDPSAWSRWMPWPNAQRADRQANIIALAHETCEMVGELRAAGVAGDPWLTAVAATRAGLPAVLAVKGVPASAQTYVDTVSAYADWYSRQPEFGGLEVAATASTDTSPAAPSTAKPLPQQYVADVLRAGQICTTVTPARIAAQLMAASGFDPNKQSAGGAQGIAQFLPEVWAAYDASSNSPTSSPFNPDSAIPTLGSAMCDLSAQLSALTAGDPYTLALAAFQWGTSAIREAGGVPQSGTLQGMTDQTLSYVDYYAKDPRLNPATASSSPSPSHSASPPAIRINPPSPATSPTPAAPPAPHKTTKSPAGPAIDTSGSYQIEDAFNGLVLDVPGDDNNPAAGVVIQQWHNQRAKDQFWRLARVGDTAYYRIIDGYSGKALAVKGGSKANGAQIVQANPSTTAPAQQWRFRDAGGGAYWIVNRKSGSVLDVLGDDTNKSDGGTVDQWSLQTYAKDQRWLLTR